MSFHERLYQLHIILGNSNEPLLWEAHSWQAIQESLARVAKSARGPASLNSLQYIPIAGGKYADAKFGRLSLTDSSLQKWIHDYEAFPERRDWLFHSVELWAPGRTTCGNQNLAPDVYLGIVNEGYYKHSSTIAFNPYIILAGAIDKGEPFLTDLNNLAATFSQQTSAVLHIQKKTPWGKSHLGLGFTDAIGDLLASSVFKPGQRHSNVPLIDQIEDYWK